VTDGTPAIEGGEPVRNSLLGYGGQHIIDADKQAVADALEGDYITRGPTVEEFERAVADFVGVDNAIAVTSGTAALHLAGRAAGFGPGDEVITTPFTFAATAHAASYQGATPAFADIDQDTRNLDPTEVRDRIGPKTAGIVPVHYAGLPCDIGALLDIASDHDLTVIWDACHAFGGTWQGEPIGAQSDVSVCSFHPVKNITTAEGGMVVTDDDELADRVRSLRSFDLNTQPAGHEDEPWYQVTEDLGFNYNVTDLQAALGLSQMERLEDFKRRRHEIAARYDEAFAAVPGIQLPPKGADADPMFHLYAVEIGPDFGCSRKRFVNAMHAENIGVQVHYVPLHYHPYFQREFGYERGAYPNAEALYERIVSLPLFPAMDDSDITDVIQAVRRLAAFYSS
jgi:dTDP-4-amino-4,6-dideoxygalactose transaminase